MDKVNYFLTILVFNLLPVRGHSTELCIVQMNFPSGLHRDANALQELNRSI